MEWWATGLIIISLLVILIALGVPIAVSMMLACLPFMVPVLGWENSLFIIMANTWRMWTAYPILALPLFIFMANIFEVSGIGKALFDAVTKWVGAIPGGLGISTVFATAIFGAMCGGSLSATAVFAMIAIPEMLARGYDKRMATGVVACSGGLAHLIPPSGYAVIYAWIIEGSAAEQLMAGAIPGVILAMLYASVVVIWTLINPDIAGPPVHYPWKERFLSLRAIIIPIIIIFAVLGTIFMGIATVVEAAAVGALASFVVVVINRRLNWAALRRALVNTARLCGWMMLIVLGAFVFSWVIQWYLIGQHLVDILVATGWGLTMMVGMLMVGYLILGCFISAIAMMFITLPLVFPILLAFGASPVWFGVLLLINIETAIITPPMGPVLYIIDGLTGPEINIGHIMRGAVPFIIGGDFVAMALVLFFPQLALWLPSLMY